LNWALALTSNLPKMNKLFSSSIHRISHLPSIKYQSTSSPGWNLHQTITKGDCSMDNTFW
jgi:hypothetical protein